MHKYKWLSFTVLVCLFLAILVKASTNVEHEESYFESDFKTFVEQNIDKGSDELALIVDSLFEVRNIDSSVLQLIQYKIDSLKFAESWEVDTNPYPAHHFYHTWNTMVSHPYPSKICKNDSSFLLELTDKDWKCDFYPPHQGHLTSKFGWRGNRMHNGVDIKLQTGDSVYACFKGVVRLAKWQSGYGWTVVIRHHNGLETIYGHLSRLKVKSGDFVEPGDCVALGGSTGRSSGSHLHFETRFKGVALNPEMFIDFNSKNLKSDSLIVKKIRYGYAAYTPGVNFYTVKNGDYLYKIAQEHGVSIGKICSLNGIRRNHLLTVGEKLQVTD